MQLGKELIVHEYADFILSALKVNLDKMLNFERKINLQSIQQDVDVAENVIFSTVLCIFEFCATRQKLSKSHVYNILNEVFNKKMVNVEEGIEYYDNFKKTVLNKFMNNRAIVNHYVEYNDRYIITLSNFVYELLYSNCDVGNEVKNELLIELQKMFDNVYYESLACFDKYEHEPHYRFESRTVNCPQTLKNYPYLLNGMAEELALTIVNGEKESGIPEKDRRNFEEIKELTTYYVLHVFCWSLAQKHNDKSYEKFVQENTLVKMFPNNGVPYEVYYKRYIEYVKSIGEDVFSRDASVWDKIAYKSLCKKEFSYSTSVDINIKIRVYTQNIMKEFLNIKLEESKTQSQDDEVKDSKHTSILEKFVVFSLAIFVAVVLYLLNAN